MKKNNFYALLAKATGRRALLGISVMLAATAGLMTSCTSNDDDPTPSGLSEAVVKEKIVGKWKLSEVNNRDQVTNGRMILTTMKMQRLRCLSLISIRKRIPISGATSSLVSIVLMGM